MTRRMFVAALICASPCVVGCGSLATSPAWVGGGVSVLAPQRAAEIDAAESAERARLAKQPQKIRARHILVMHKESRSKPENVSRTRAQARDFAQACLLKIRGGAEFTAAVKECSDEPGAGESGGDLGPAFERARMVKAFSDAAFALKIGEVSEVVETPYGFHIIMRTE